MRKRAAKRALEPNLRTGTCNNIGLLKVVYKREFAILLCVPTGRLADSPMLCKWIQAY